MSRVIITIDDVPDGTTVSCALQYPTGKVGTDCSMAEAVAHDFKKMLAGRLNDTLLEYIQATPLSRRASFTVIDGGGG